MTREVPPSQPDPVRSAIQSQHPGIADEIEGAIKTLRKLKQIADPDAPGASATRPIRAFQRGDHRVTSPWHGAVIRRAGLQEAGDRRRRRPSRKSSARSRSSPPAPASAATRSSGCSAGVRWVPYTSPTTRSFTATWR